MLGTTLAARYRIERELGRGDRSVVYRAHDEILQRPVALKVLASPLDPDLMRRVRVEGAVLGRLMHPGIARLYEVGCEGETLLLVSQAIDGPSLREAAAGPAGPDRTGRLAWLIPVAEALDVVHRQGLCHGALRPEHLRLDPASGRPMLTDFALAALRALRPEGARARAGGSAEFLCPEQVRGRPADARSDLYALGVLLYEAATGTLPFAGRLDDVLAQQVGAFPEPLRLRAPDLPADLEALVLALLAKDPEARPHRASAVAAGLRAILPTLAPAEPVPTNGHRRAGAGAVAAPARPPAEPARPRVEAPAGRGWRPWSDPFGDLIDQLVAVVTDEPIAVTPEARHLTGHYLADLMATARGDRRLERLHVDRARLLLAMAALGLPDGAVEVDAAAALFEHGLDPRSRLGPVVVLRYLAARDTPARRKRFRRRRSELLEASPRLARLADARGVPDPGFLPQGLAELRRFAPARPGPDAALAARWNVVAEVWRGNPTFRRALLAEGTNLAADDPGALDLWPEVLDALVLRALRPRRPPGPLDVIRDLMRGPLEAREHRLARALAEALPRPQVLAYEREAPAIPGPDRTEAPRRPAAPAAAATDPAATPAGPPPAPGPGASMVEPAE